MNDKFKVRAYREAAFHDRIEIMVYHVPEHGNGDLLCIGQPVVFVGHDRSFMASRPAPTLSLPVEAAQALMDELWGAGLRPSEGTGSAGALAAVQRHLEDMRTLVFEPRNEGGHAK